MAATVEINDGVFCAAHIQEVCEECDADLREENDGYYGFDTIDRDALEVPDVSVDNDGTYHCKKHDTVACSQCFCWKKKITRLRTEAKKTGRAQGD